MLPDPKRVLAASKQRSTEFTEMYREVTEVQTKEPPRPVYLRPSGFPVCSLTLLDAILHPQAQDWNYASAFFTGVGTTVHSIVETWASKTSGRLWGNWKCHRGHTWEHTDDSICPTCNGKGHYEEITISYMGVKGHIDCILITPSGVLVGDYKTSTKYGVDKPTFRDHNHAYALQISTYTYMLERVWGDHFEEKYGVRTAGCSLLFISRDNPFRYREFTWGREDALAFGKQTIRGAVIAWRSVQRSLGTGELRHAMHAKNCPTGEVYDTEVSKYFCYEPCHLSGICFSRKLSAEYFADLPEKHAKLTATAASLESKKSITRT